MFQQWIEGQDLKSETGADFAVAIKATQVAGRAFVDHRKVPLEKRLESLRNFTSSLIAHETQWTEALTAVLGYPRLEAHHEWLQAKNILLQTEERLKVFPEQLPLGPCLIYGSWSSPLIRVCQSVVAALVQGNAVILLTSHAASFIYTQLAQTLTASGFPAALLTVIATDDRETQETLLSHPAVRAVHWVSHFYEGDGARLAYEPNKKVKLFFGGHNPVIFSHDANLSDLAALSRQALRYHFRGHERFHRWFVQEKIYPVFLEEFKKVWEGFKPGDFGSIPDGRYAELYGAQMSELAKEKSWITPASQALADDRTLFPHAAVDFNNCSSWQQSEVLGPVLTITRFKNSQEAVKFANTTLFANAACVLTSSREKSAEIGAQLQMPKIYLNALPSSYTDEATRAGYQSGQGNDLSDFQFFSYPKSMN